MRGIGKIYKRGNVWWVYFHHHGKAYRESSHSDSEFAASALLKKRLGEIGRGKLIGPQEGHLTFEHLADALLIDYKINNRRSFKSIELSIRHLGATFAFSRAVDITSDCVKRYVLMRQEEGARNSSINRELAALRRMFSLAVKEGRLSTSPYISMLDENNARQGFLHHANFLTLRNALPDYLKDPVMFLYLSGWRVGEMRSLQWRDIDLPGRVIRLRAENSKNKTGRTLPLSGELLGLIQRAHEKRRLDCVHVFHDDGRPIGDFRKAWAKACKAAGVAGLLVHDLRRTAVRNMVKAGIPERVAMALSGHKTRSIFDRYHVVSESDLMEATERLQSHLGTLSSPSASGK